MVGQVLDKLDKLGLAENMLVVLTSDNGGVNHDNGPDKVHDPGETKTLAAAHPDRVTAMAAKLAEITGQPLPKKDKQPESE